MEKAHPSCLLKLNLCKRCSCVAAHSRTSKQHVLATSGPRHHGNRLCCRRRCPAGSARRSDAEFCVRAVCEHLCAAASGRCIRYIGDNLGSSLPLQSGNASERQIGGAAIYRLRSGCTFTTMGSVLITSLGGVHAVMLRWSTLMPCPGTCFFRCFLAQKRYMWRRVPSWTATPHWMYAPAGAPASIRPASTSQSGPIRAQPGWMLPHKTGG